MPCLNEEEAIGVCIQKIKTIYQKHAINGEIVVSDNGSTDKSVAIASDMGVRVVHQPLRGYGNAYLKGFEEARGKYLIMVDADDTYDFDLIPEFIKKLNEGYAFVTGSRYMSSEGNKNITFLHRIIGNPFLTMLLNFLFGIRYTDVYCGYRAFTREAYALIEPVSPGMEFNLELAINAWKAGLKITEIPIDLRPRKGQSKLRTFKDGWRSLRMMVLYCPNKVFIFPGVFLLSLGFIIHMITLFGLVSYQGRSLGVGTAIFGTIFSVLGFQIATLGLCAKTYSWSRRFDKENAFLERFYKYFNLEGGLSLGGFLILLGGGALGHYFSQWLHADMIPLAHPERVAFAATLVILGFNTFFSALFISTMSIRK